MIKTKIEWCDSSWNPVSGCLHDCPYCYARGTANRFKGCNLSPNGVSDEIIVELEEKLEVTNKDSITRTAAYPYGFTPTLHKYRLQDPLKKGLGKTIFVCSTADLFGKWVPDEWITQVFDVCKQALNHRYLFLTKNPARYYELAEKGLLPTGDSFCLSLLVQILVIKLEGQGIDRVVMDVQIELKTTTNDEDDVGSKLFFQSLQIALDSNGDGVINSGFQGGAGCGESLLLFFIFRIHFTQDVFNLSHDGLGVDYDILPMLSEYWFDDINKLQRWENILRGVFQ